MRSTPDLEIIMTEKTYINFKVNPIENFEHHINDLLNENYFPQFKCQVSYLAKFTKIVNGDEVVFHKWVKSEINYNHFNEDHTIHNTLIQKLDDEQLEGSGFQFQEIEEVVLETYKVNDIQSSSYIELPEQNKNNKSLINIKNNDQYCFLWCILAHLYPVEDHKKTLNYSMHFTKLKREGLEFPMKVKDIPKLENLNRLNVYVFELNGNVLTPIQINTSYNQPQIDLMLYKNHYSLNYKVALLNI